MGKRREIVLGFDPGKPGKFGWCVAILKGGYPSKSSTRVCHPMRRMPLQTRSTRWTTTTSWSRPELTPRYIGGPIGHAVDLLVREAIARRGAQNAHGTVQQINSLRGACLIQGVMIGMLLQRRLPRIVITEAHPKALLWLHRIREPLGSHHSRWTCRIHELEKPKVTGDAADIRDAALAALTAWAAVRRPPEWQDLSDSGYP